MENAYNKLINKMGFPWFYKRKSRWYAPFRFRAGE